MLIRGVASFSQSISPRSLTSTRFSQFLTIYAKCIFLQFLENPLKSPLHGSASSRTMFLFPITLNVPTKMSKSGIGLTWGPTMKCPNRAFCLWPIMTYYNCAVLSNNRIASIVLGSVPEFSGNVRIESLLVLELPLPNQNGRSFLGPGAILYQNPRELLNRI